jgi:hypothetical protein
VPLGHSNDVRRLGGRRTQQRVEDRNRPGDGQAATDVEGSPGRGRHAHSPDRLHLVVGQLIAVDNRASLSVPVVAHNLRGRGRIEPFGARDGGGGEARQRCARRQPCRTGFGDRRELRFPVDVHVAEHRSISRPQIGAGDGAAVERLAA